jgi:hypothetical protein
VNHRRGAVAGSMGGNRTAENERGGPECGGRGRARWDLSKGNGATLTSSRQISVIGLPTALEGRGVPCVGRAEPWPTGKERGKVTTRAGQRVRHHPISRPRHEPADAGPSDHPAGGPGTVGEDLCSPAEQPGKRTHGRVRLGHRGGVAGQHAGRGEQALHGRAGSGLREGGRGAGKSGAENGAAGSRRHLPGIDRKRGRSRKRLQWRTLASACESGPKPGIRNDDPIGTRTRVTGMKTRCPRPLDDGA